MKEIIIKNGLFFDGKGNPPIKANLHIADGKIKSISKDPIAETGNPIIIDASDKWVMPGFIDLHTHYDAEVEAIPSLPESLRHGITTAFVGSCSLTTAIGDPTDIADQFTRVEGIPYEHLLPLMKKVKNWNSMKGYVDHINSLPLGPNIASFVGYSGVRAYVLGLERSLDPKVKPTEDELKKMEAILEEGYDAGMLGLSLNKLYWDKMGGDRFRSKCLPSTYASWSELRRMVKGVRKRDLNLQAIPNISTKYELFIFAAMSAGLFMRKALKTTLVSIMDLRSNRFIYKLLQFVGFFYNKVLGSKFRYQALPVMFDLWADGFENVVFEEFGAGAAGLHLSNAVERQKLFKDKKYRNWFSSQWKNPIIPKVFHRNFGMATVMKCPDKSLVGRTFKEIAGIRGKSDVETFLDLLAEYGNELRWYTVMGNDRPKALASILNSESILVGFSDAGAHLRNMAFYNYPIRMLKFVNDSHKNGKPVLSLEKCVHRLTGEIADWFEIEAGTLEIGKRADIVVIDPKHLDYTADEIHEEKIPELGGYTRLVRRNPKAVPAVLVNGRLAVQEGNLLPEIGKEKGFGQYLKVKKKN